MKVSVLIPIKNEPYINKLIKDIHKTLKNYDHEIIVIDKSDVLPKINDAKLIVQKSIGLGKAILEGLQYAKGDIIITIDGDGSHRPKDLLQLLNKIKNYDIVLGSRFVRGAKNLDTTHRKLIGKIYRHLSKLILHLDIQDNMSGFAAVKKIVYNKLKLNPIGYKINLEILYKGKKAGFKSTEVPIIFYERKVGNSKAGITEGLRTLFFIFKLALE